jgi:hypothetical protein
MACRWRCEARTEKHERFRMQHPDAFVKKEGKNYTLSSACIYSLRRLEASIVATICERRAVLYDDLVVSATPLIGGFQLRAGPMRDGSARLHQLP